MKRNILIIFLLSAFVGASFAQVLIRDGNRTETCPHDQAILDVRSDDRGVIIPTVDYIRDLPRHNPATGGFNPDPGLEGAIAYVRSRRMIYRFDGNTWLPAPQIGMMRNQNITRLGFAESHTFVNVLGGDFVGARSIRISPQTDPARFLVNNVGHFGGANNPYNHLVITESGLYHISATIGISSGTNVGIDLAGAVVDIYAWIDALYPGEQDNRWLTFGSNHISVFGGILGDWAQDGHKSITASATTWLEAGTRIRVGALVQPNALIQLGGGYTTSTNPADSNITIQRLF